MPTTDRKSRSGSDNRRRGGIIKVRVDDAELAAIDVAAARAGLSPPAFIRAMCVGAPGARSIRRPPVEHAALSQILGNLGRVGSNLNQIARALNTGRDTPFDIPEVIGELRIVAAEIMRALGRRAA